MIPATVRSSSLNNMKLKKSGRCRRKNDESFDPPYYHCRRLLSVDSVDCYHSLITHCDNEFSSSKRRPLCSCDRLRFTEIIEEHDDDRPPSVSSKRQNSFEHLRTLCVGLIISLLTKLFFVYERWKFVLVRCKRFILALICLIFQFGVIQHSYLFRPIGAVLFHWCNNKKEANKQNLRWQHQQQSPTTTTSPPSSNSRRSSATGRFYCCPPLSRSLLLQWLYYLLVLNYLNSLFLPLFPSLPKLLPLAEACSSRPSPKPRPPRPVWTPDLPNVLRENCTEDYAELFCLNGGICFRSKMLEQYAFGCECAIGWYGRRCEYSDIGPRVHLPQQQRVETASIAGGVAVLVILLVFVAMILYVYRRRTKLKASGQAFSSSAFEEPAHRTANILSVRPFSVRRSDSLQPRATEEV